MLPRHRRTIPALIAVAALGLGSAAPSALASHGSDDAPGHVRHSGADDGKRHHHHRGHHHRHGADDGANHS